MAQLDTIDSLPALLKDVAREIAELLDKGLESHTKRTLPKDKSGREAQLEIRETLTIWRVKYDAFKGEVNSTLSKDVSDYVEQSRLLHHQIWLNTEPVAFARSLRYRDRRRLLTQFNVSIVAAQINEALRIVENDASDDSVIIGNPVVRILEIPAFHILTLWIFAEAERESRILVVNAARRYRGLERKVFLTSEQFIQAVRTGGLIRGVA